VTRNLRIDFALGQAGAFRVSSELLMRGMNTWLPSVDFGSDLMTGNGCRLQVKAARLSTRGNAKYYWFTVEKGRHRASQDKPDYYVL
jgi:hypothetical protein